MESRWLKFCASSRSLRGVANLPLVPASRAPSDGWRRLLSCFHGDNRVQPPEGGGGGGRRGVCGLLTGESVRYSWCLCSLSPAGYARVRRLSLCSPSCMLLWFRAVLSRAELSRADWLGSVRHEEEPEGWFDVFTEQPEWAEFPSVFGDGG